jgi:beta-glucanase (GH16 family)
MATILPRPDRCRNASWLVCAAALAGCGPSHQALPEGPPQNVGSTTPGDDAAVAPSDDASSSSTGDATQPPSTSGADAAAPRDAGAAGDASIGAADAGSPGDAADAGGPERCTSRKAVDTSTWNLVWSDEFAGSGAPDSTKWGYEKGFVRNQELQWYQPDNATVGSGLLTIAAQKQQVANPNYDPSSSDWKKSRQFAQYTSTSMTSSGKWSYEYGRFEMCGKIDTRQGSWPAFWVLGNGKSWPSSGEVDIMEYYASGVRANVCKPSGSNCDWSGSVSQSLSSLGGSTWSSEFHLWAMEWDTQSINLSLDDKLVYGFKVSSAVSSGTNPYMGNPFFVIVNQAIGANGGDPTSTTFPITYQVDYVRVYQKK